MKLALGKRGKLLLLVGTPVVFVLACSLYLAFHKGTIEVGFDAIQVGMECKEVETILNERMIPTPTLVAHGRYRMYTTPEEPSDLIPGTEIEVIFDDEGKLMGKSVHPTLFECWNNWKRRLGF